MNTYSTSQAARRLGIGIKTLSRYIAEQKVPAPQIINIGGRAVHLWTLAEIEHVRQLLPKIANGRKTRYKKKQSAVSDQRSAVSSQQKQKRKRRRGRLRSTRKPKPKKK